ncbi:metal-dependent hydrolase family protein [Mesorhizobium sp. NZP2298]|uniref:metal-dependent hydrolase family protein n=1 Tax=Mesorhizobium sp. NZP2298 TaxID=2483403 RepID=UPI001FEEB92C|nr:amidohydrolase family protein [Mesorhizobium sp. NZP2298]
MIEEEIPMPSFVFENARVLDGSSDDGEYDRHIRVSEGMIDEVSDKPIKDANAIMIDLKGKTLMPGLIDCHVHVYSAAEDPSASSRMPNELVALHAAKIVKGMLLRGFTTVRDVGGATLGFKYALESGLIDGPRLTMCGKAFVQSGGHTDPRERGELISAETFNNQLGNVSKIVDGVDECRRAAREEIRKGAQFIKVMAGGGAAQLRMPRSWNAYSMDELRAFQEEAENAKTYVCVHAHSDESIARALACGIKSIEHCTLITPATAAIMAEKGAYSTPTISAYEGQIIEAERLGLDAAAVERLQWVRDRGPESLEIMHKAGVKICHGSDHLGFLHPHQNLEFNIRAEALPPIEVIRSTTINAAELCLMAGKVGTIAAGAYADMIVIDGDPLKDISLLGDEGKSFQAIMKGGVFYKNELSH